MRREYFFAILTDMRSRLALDRYILRDNDLILDAGEREYVLRVRDLPIEEKPREKLMRYGPASLSARELLAVVLGVGTKKEEVLAMTSRIMQEYGEQGIAHQTDPRHMAQEFNLPLVKACQIVASFELGKRFFRHIPNGLVAVRTPKQVFEYLKDMRELPKECLRGIYLNSHYKIIHDETISIGSLTANIVHPREVFRPAFSYSAVAVIVAHNHPSGSVHPSQADIEITRQLVETGKIVGIDLLDHIIITKHKFVSIPELYLQDMPPTKIKV